MACARLTGDAQWKEKREWAQTDIRGGEEGMEMGNNTVKTEMGPQSQTSCPWGLQLGMRGHRDSPELKKKMV